MFFAKNHPLGNGKKPYQPVLNSQDCLECWQRNPEKKLTNHTELLLFLKIMATSGKRIIDVLYTTSLEVFESTCITSLWLNQPFQRYDLIVKSLGLVLWLAAYLMTSLPHPAMPVESKRRRIGGDATTGGEGLTELEVLSISGECLVTLNVSDSMCGRDLWNLILGEVPTKAWPSVGCVP